MMKSLRLSSVVAIIIASNPMVPVQAQSFGDAFKRAVRERMRQRPLDNQRAPHNDDVLGRSAALDDDSIAVEMEEARLATSPVTFAYSSREIDRLRSQLLARNRRAIHKQEKCRETSKDWDNDCELDSDRMVSSFHQVMPKLVGDAVLALPPTYDSLKILKSIDTDFWAWSNHYEPRDGRLRQTVEFVKQITELRRTQLERSLRPQIIADVTRGNRQLIDELFGDDTVREKFYGEYFQRSIDLANAPPALSNEGKILAAAINSLYQSPGLAAARAINIVERRIASIRIGAVGSYYRYSIDVRNAKCRITEKATSCNYNMKLGVQTSLMGLELPAYEMDWIPRQDVFRTSGGQFVSADLTTAMNKVADIQSARSKSMTSGGGVDLAAIDRDNERIERAVQDVQNGLYSTGKVIYDKP